jgi:hypothetical protein
MSSLAISAERYTYILKSQLTLENQSPIDALLKPSFTAPIEVHARWIFENIYLKKPVRLTIHGTLHASRVAHAIPLLQKIYLGLEASRPELSEDELKITQLAGLFHDMARLHDGVDEFDLASAASGYAYLKNMRDVPEGMPELLANIIANKDSASETYRYQILEADPFEAPQAPQTPQTSEITEVTLTPVDGGKSESELAFIFEKIPQTKTDQKRNRLLAEDLLHDADCLDIMRCETGKAFDARFLRLYQLFSETKLHPRYFAWLRDAWFQLIYFHGDLSWARDQETFETYEAKFQCFLRVSNDIHGLNSDGSPRFPLLYEILKPGPGSKIILSQLLTEKPWSMPLSSEPLSAEEEEKNSGHSEEKGQFPTHPDQLHRALQTEGFIARFIHIRHSAAPSHYIRTWDYINALELELFYSSKPEGNRNRSLSLLTSGVIPISSIGFLLKNSEVTYTSLNDINSGWGEHQRMEKAIYFIKENQPSFASQKLPASTHADTRKTTPLYRLKLETELKFPHYDKPDTAFRHTEVHLDYQIQDIQGIIYCLDNIRKGETKEEKAFREWEIRLQAFYSQKKTSVTCKKNLPIFRFSGIEGSMAQDEITIETLIQEGKNLFNNYMTSTDLILTGTKEYKKIKFLLSSFDFTIFLEIDQHLKDHLKQKIQHIISHRFCGYRSPEISHEYYYVPRYLDEHPSDIATALEKFMSNNEFLLQNNLLTDPRSVLATEATQILKVLHSDIDELLRTMLFARIYPYLLQKGTKTERKILVEARLEGYDKAFTGCQLRLGYFLASLAIIKKEDFPPSIAEKIESLILSTKNLMGEVLAGYLNDILIFTLKDDQETGYFYDVLKDILIKKMNREPFEGLIKILDSRAPRELKKELFQEVALLPSMEFPTTVFPSLKMIESIKNTAQRLAQFAHKEKVSHWILRSYHHFMAMREVDPRNRSFYDFIYHFHDFFYVLNFFSLMTLEDQKTMFIEMKIRNPHGKAILASQEDLSILIQLMDEEKKYPFAFTPKEVEMMTQKITEEMDVLKEKALAHHDKEAAAKKFLLVSQYVESILGKKVEESLQLEEAPAL